MLRSSLLLFTPRFCWLVRQRNDASTQCPCLYESEFLLLAAFSEETLSLPHHNRMDQQPILIDEIMLHEQIDKIAATVN